MPTSNYEWSYIADGDTVYPVSHSALVDAIDAELSRVEGVVDSKPDTDTDTQLSDEQVHVAINNDSDHGTTANHDYFSASHNDLADVGAADHHDPDAKADVGHGHGGSTRLYASATGQSIPNKSFTTIQYDTATDDGLGGADTAGNQITVPSAGTYLFINNVRLVGVPSGSRAIARIDAGGTELARADSHAAVSNGGTLAGRVSDVRALAAGDSVTGLVWQDSGGALDPRMNEAETFLAVVRIG